MTATATSGRPACRAWYGGLWADAAGGSAIVTPGLTVSPCRQLPVLPACWQRRYHRVRYVTAPALLALQVEQQAWLRKSIKASHMCVGVCVLCASTLPASQEERRALQARLRAAVLGARAAAEAPPRDAATQTAPPPPLAADFAGLTAAAAAPPARADDAGTPGSPPPPPPAPPEVCPSALAFQCGGAQCDTMNALCLRLRPTHRGRSCGRPSLRRSCDSLPATGCVLALCHCLLGDSVPS